MKDELYKSASEFGQSALRAYLDNNRRVFLLHAATALEQLLKAHLASKHPSLIAAPDFDSLLHACGMSAHAHRPPSLMKTISMKDALERSSQMIPPIGNLKVDLNLLVDVRNGVIHLGLVDEQSVKRVLLPFLKAIDHLLHQLQRDRLEFWRDMHDLATTRLSDSSKESEVRAVEVIASAKLEFDRRFGGMPGVLRDNILRTIENAYSPAKYEEQLVDCPACSRLALVSGTYKVDWEADWDYSEGEAWPVGVYPVVRFYPGHLGCRICGLELDGEDALQAAGIEASWELDNVDPKDFDEPELETET